MSDNCGITVKIDRAQRGDTGETGVQGETGLNAYEIAVQQGFVGDYDAWLASLKGEKGDKGEASTIDGTDLGTAAFKDVGAENGNVPVYDEYGISGTGVGATTVRLAGETADAVIAAIKGKTGFYSTDIDMNIDGDGVFFRYSPFIYSRCGGVNFILSAGFKGAGVGVKARVFNDAQNRDTVYQIYTDNNPVVYETTTASGANVVVTDTGELQRSTSSMKYKQLLGDLVLNDDSYNAAMTLQPIIYRSTAPADNPEHHYFSFSAEALGAHDPAFVFWRTTEKKEITEVDDDGNEVINSETVPLDKPKAEGININALLASQHAVDVYQGKLIADLLKRVADLEQQNK